MNWEEGAGPKGWQFSSKSQFHGPVPNNCDSLRHQIRIFPVRLSFTIPSRVFALFSRLAGGGSNSTDSRERREID